MFGFYNYNKPGKGVNKRDPNQPRMSLFWELLYTKLWNLCKMNFLYILLAIPTFVVTMLMVGVVSSRITDVAVPVLAEAMGLAADETSNIQLGASVIRFDLVLRYILAFLFMMFLGMGPATAGITYTLRNFAREEHAWLWSDTWRNVKSNFKQAIALWIIDLALFFVMSVALTYYAQMGGIGTAVIFLLLSVCFAYLMMHVYVYQIMITFELPLKHIIKNSVILSLMTAPKTILLLLVQVALHIAIPVLLLIFGGNMLPIIIFILLEFVFLPAATMFMTNFFIYPTVEKLIKQALEQNNEANVTEGEQIQEGE